jgi:hypothetical protein
MEPLEQQIDHLHRHYCRLTGQNLSLRFDRQRLWYEFLHAGFTPQDLERVLRYLQREIRRERRNVGALKLSNLLALDRFEEDLNISRVRLTTPPPPKPAASVSPPTPCSPAQQEQARQNAIRRLRQLQENLRKDLI